MFELMDAYSQSAVIKVIGVGGGGGNAVAHMVSAGIDGVEFMCVNTDSQALKHAKVKTALQIGCNITKGLGAGADPAPAPERRRWWRRWPASSAF
jgi:cell division protein FtsZ